MSAWPRLAIVSSPRSGNSWVRLVLAGALGVPELSVHNYLDLPAELPPRCVLQMHWVREPNFRRWLRAHGFTVVTIARHPLDLLLSALHFVASEPETARWLEGDAGLPGGLAGAAPGSAAFLGYALGFGAETLLSVTYQWWQEPAAVRLRYEALVRDPAALLGALVASCGGDPGQVATWLEEASLPAMQARANRHGWQGSPGLWRRLIVPRDARRIFHRHRQVFQTLGYGVPPYFLSRAAAARNWQALA